MNYFIGITILFTWIICALAQDSGEDYNPLSDDFIKEINYRAKTWRVFIF